MYDRPAQEHLDSYWAIRLETLAKTLEDNRFEVHLATDAADAVRIAIDVVLPPLVEAHGKPVVAFGGSMSICNAGLVDALKARPDCQILDTLDMTVPYPELVERRRQALLSDLLVTSSNAVTEDGRIVNLDGTGNRVAGLCFGPRNVLLVIGRNKVAPGLDEAMDRVANLAAPTNAMRLKRKTPCVKTGRCMDCDSPERICSVWTITEKSSPRGRIKIILVNQDMGF